MMSWILSLPSKITKIMSELKEVTPEELSSAIDEYAAELKTGALGLGVTFIFWCKLRREGWSMVTPKKGLR